MKKLIFPHIDPVAFHIGPFGVHWYGLMYLFGFMLIWFLMLRQSRNMAEKWTRQQLEDVIFYGAIGVVLGGRIGYMLFYNFSQLIANPLSLLAVWEGGMSFHGGAIGVFVMLLWLSRKQQRPFYEISDFLLPYVPLGLALGRVGNFINGELWGRYTSQPWGMIFPQVDPFPRHPSQIYEFFLEGILLFLVLRIYARKPRPPYAVSALFLIGYGCVRFLIEFFREPDRQLGYLAMDWFTMGQLLSIPMILMGILLITRAYRKCCNI